MELKKYLAPQINVKTLVMDEQLLAGSNYVSDDGTEAYTGDTSSEGDASGAYSKPHYNLWGVDADW